MPQSVKLATFNLENLGHRGAGRAGLEARAEALRPQLERLAADLLCLQEVDGQWSEVTQRRELLALDHLLAPTRYGGYHRVSSTSRSGRGVADVHNLVILSRYPFAGHQELHHDIVPPPAYRPVTADPPAGDAEAIRWDRPVLAAAVELPAGGRLHVLNLHLRAPLAAVVAGQKIDAFRWKSVAGWAEGFFLATVKRSGQALEARLWIERLFDEDPDALIAVCGDFNAEVREMPLRTLRGDVEDTGNPALAGRALVALEKSLPETRRYSLMHAGERLMLDHFLVSRRLLARFRDLEVHNEELLDETTAPADTPGSFHAPLVARFDF
jgi:endonuclease/exonuclease/phosphatase family metal-dependent hydrolase